MLFNSSWSRKSFSLSCSNFNCSLIDRTWRSVRKKWQNLPTRVKGRGGLVTWMSSIVENCFNVSNLSYSMNVPWRGFTGLKTLEPFTDRSFFVNLAFRVSSKFDICIKFAFRNCRSRKLTFLKTNKQILFLGKRKQKKNYVRKLVRTQQFL